MDKLRDKLRGDPGSEKGAKKKAKHADEKVISAAAKAKKKKQDSKVVVAGMERVAEESAQSLGADKEGGDGDELSFAELTPPGSCYDTKQFLTELCAMPWRSVGSFFVSGPADVFGPTYRLAEEAPTGCAVAPVRTDAVLSSQPSRLKVHLESGMMMLCLAGDGVVQIWDPDLEYCVAELTGNNPRGADILSGSAIQYKANEYPGEDSFVVFLAENGSNEASAYRVFPHFGQEGSVRHGRSGAPVREQTMIVKLHQTVSGLLRYPQDIAAMVLRNGTPVCVIADGANDVLRVTNAENFQELRVINPHSGWPWQIETDLSRNTVFVRTDRGTHEIDPNNGQKNKNEADSKSAGSGQLSATHDGYVFSGQTKLLDMSTGKVVTDFGFHGVDAFCVDPMRRRIFFVFSQSGRFLMRLGNNTMIKSAKKG